MAKAARTGKKSAATTSVSAKGGVIARAYTSPTLVLLAMDWPDGAKFDDFLGFSILRSPGFHPGEKDAFLVNKISFSPPTPDSQSLPSNLAPFQKFMWWDAGIDDKDRGKTFTYTITPVRGSGPNDLKPVSAAAAVVKAMLPNVEEDGISTWFNRAVVSSQAFSRQFPDPAKKIDDVMKWLANGLQDAFPKILAKANAIDGAIYHLTDKEWVMPALKGFKGDLALVYEDRKNDQTDAPAIKQLKSSRFTGNGRTKTNIMHDKFLVDGKNGRVLMGSANFTPEGLTYQANLLHIFNSPQLAKLYAARQKLMRGDPTVGETATGAAWSNSVKVGKASVRVFFSPEPKGKRASLDTVVKAIKAAKSSVMFCMFSPTDAALLRALLATSDRKKLLYGMLNSISDPSKKKKKANTDENLSDSGEAPRKPSEATQVQVELFHRSRKDRKVLAYNYFRPKSAPAGFLPEFSSVDLSSRSTLPPPKPGKKGGPPAVHIHHKFIIIDADTDQPTIYTGSANLSANSTNHNDENLLEITGSPALAQLYLAEFQRIYQHYRARALWNIAHPGAEKAPKAKKPSPAAAKRIGDTFTLKTKRDDWVKNAYKRGSPEFLERQTLAKA